MKPLPRVFKTSFIVASFCLLTACGEDQPNKISNSLLIGQWNSYEWGTEENGFAQQPSNSLTLVYESGITFSNDGTFKSRFYAEGNWTESSAPIGSFKIKDEKILLTFSPNTIDEFVLTLDVLKLDDNHLWFSHDHFVEMDYHLEKAN
jgi:hypothetical protein